MMLRVLITVYLIGSLIFLTEATFLPDVYAAWNKAYYVWSFSIDVLFGLCILYPSKSRFTFRPVFILIAAKYLAQLLFVFTELRLNDVKVVGVLFILSVLICLYLFGKETVIEWRRSN